MGDIHYIVDKLNAAPFQYNLSLLSFRCGSSAGLSCLGNMPVGLGWAAWVRVVHQ